MLIKGEIMELETRRKILSHVIKRYDEGKNYIATWQELMAMGFHIPENSVARMYANIKVAKENEIK